MNNGFKVSTWVTALTIGLLGAIGLAVAGDATRLSEPVAVTDTHEIFGAEVPDLGATVNLTELINNSAEYQDKEVLVATRIAKVCQKKGCFFVATEGAATARVSFKDYGFFIPTDSGGKDVLLAGVFSRAVITDEQAEHFSQDLSETTKASPEDFQYSIVASAVKIPRG